MLCVGGREIWESLVDAVCWGEGALGVFGRCGGSVWGGMGEFGGGCVLVWG